MEGNLYTQLTEGLTHHKFLESPSEFLLVLKNIKNLDVSQDTRLSLAQSLNQTDEYETWFSPALHWVFYATGDLATDNLQSNFFTSGISISQDMGIEMFDLMMELGADINLKNYYDEDVYGLVRTHLEGPDVLTKRKNNDRFVDHIVNKYL